MRIVFICLNLEGGGAERVIQTLSEYYIQIGFKVTIICLEKSKYKIKIDENVDVLVLKTSFLSNGIFKFFSIFIQMWELDFHLRKLGEPFAISFLGRANLCFLLTSFLSKRNIVISERSHSDYANSKKFLKRTVYNFLIKKLYKKAEKIIAISNGVKSSLVQVYSIPEEKIIVIYNPVDIKKK